VALQLAVRGRARSVVAFAPPGGWKPGDPGFEAALAGFETTRELLPGVLPYVDRFVSTPEGRRRATAHFAVNGERLPPELVAHLMRGAAACDGAPAFMASSRRDGWHLDAERVTCPVRFVWGSEDRIVEWPSGAARFREEWLPQAEYVVLDDVGHCPQLDVPLEAAELILGLTAS